MKKEIMILIAMMFLTSFISAEIIINEAPKELYISGEVIELPVKISSTVETNNFLYMNLLCGTETEVHKEFISLASGDEKQIKATIPLIKSFIGNSQGTCKIKISLGDEYVLTDEFTISDTITISFDKPTEEITPGETFKISGEAIKANDESPKNGIIEITIKNNNYETILIKDTLNAKTFDFDFDVPEDFPSKESILQIKIYEKDYSGEITNNGILDTTFNVKAVPTNLEIKVDSSTINPGENIKTKVNLKDQSGQLIDSTAIITIKNSNNKILAQEEKDTDEYLEFAVDNEEKAGNWSIYAISNKLSSEIPIFIPEKKEIKIELENNTIVISNIGNVLYEEDVVIKVGDEPITIPVKIKVGDTQTYSVSAPNGAYNIDIFSGEEKTFSGTGVMLTGNAINVERISDNTLKVITHPISWIFVILLLSFIAFTIFKKGYKRSFFGRIPFNKKPTKKLEKNEIPEEPKYIPTQNKADISLSIKGEKHTASVICLKLKNTEEFSRNNEAVKNTFQKIGEFTEDAKTTIYENKNNIFILCSPITTKTFNNEKIAIDLAKKIEDKLLEHNKLFNKHITFGISVHKGILIASLENNKMNFMSMGTLITTAKKVAGLAENKILVTKEIKEKLIQDITTIKEDFDGIEAYSLDKIKEKNKHDKFIKDFVSRLDK